MLKTPVLIAFAPFMQLTLYWLLLTYFMQKFKYFDFVY